MTRRVASIQRIACRCRDNESHTVPTHRVQEIASLEAWAHAAGSGRGLHQQTAYQYVLDLRGRIEETCQLAQEEIAKIQKRNQTYYNRRAIERRLNIGDSVLLLLPTENNKLTLGWRGPYEVVEKVGEVDHKIRVK